MADITIPGMDAALLAAATASDWSKQIGDLTKQWTIDQQLTESLAEAVASATSFARYSEQISEPFNALREHAADQARAMDALTRRFTEPVNAMREQMAGFAESFSYTEAVAKSVSAMRGYEAQFIDEVRAMNEQTRRLTDPVKAMQEQMALLTESIKMPTLPDYLKSTPNWTSWMPPAFPEPHLRYPETPPLPIRRAWVKDHRDAEPPPCFISLGVDGRYFPKHFFRLVQSWFEDQMERHGRSSIPGCGCHEGSTAEKPLVVMVTEEPETGTIIFQCADCSKRDLRGPWAELREARRGLQAVDGGSESTAPRVGHLSVVTDDE